METTNNNAKIYIKRYTNIEDIRRICPYCSFEKTKQSKINGFCMLCEKFYDFPLEDKENNNCCIIN